MTELAASPNPRRIDLHCHSDASNKAAEVMLNAIRCPECYSSPDEVYAQARRRGMDFVTLTDHDTIAGALRMAHLPDVLVGEELTCWFPEDQCKLHLLIYGITAQQHEKLQSIAANLYDVAAYIERERIAHSVAHPIYRQNDKLERWHLERLLVLFKGFECLNGAHSPLHREAFEPLLAKLDAAQIQKLSEKHDLRARWPEPWRKARTAGSDDHGLLNIGRTWTEFSPDVRTTADVLEALREGNCCPAGESGSSAKLAHTFYSVAVRYYGRQIVSPGQKLNLPARVLQTVVGEMPAPKKQEIVRRVVANKLKKLTRKIVHPFTPPPADTGTAGVLRKLFIDSFRARLGEHPSLREALDRALPPLGEHEEMFRLVSSLNADVSAGVAAAISKAIDDASFTGLFDAIGALLAQQFVLLPYYFAVFHQNKERHLLRQITGLHTQKQTGMLHVGLFTDTLDDVNGVGRFLRGLGGEANRLGRKFQIHTCSDSPTVQLACRKNFVPLLTRPMPCYSELKLTLPPVLDILEWADRQQFDAIHVSTPGPMGLCGWLVAKALRVPLLATYHTDFPKYVDHLTRDHRMTNGTIAYLKWFYGQCTTIFSRSREYTFALRDLGLADEKVQTLPPCVDSERFNPRHRDDGLWTQLGVRESRRLLYAGRVSVEKNLPMLADVFAELCRTHSDTALVIAGDGPWLQTMRQRLAGLPAYFLGYQDDAKLSALYASSDLLVFPSRTDTLGQVVLEAQASGLPAIVSTEGGPREIIAPKETGLALPGNEPETWRAAIADLLDDNARRLRMARSASGRMARFAIGTTFDAFWQAHLAAAEPVVEEDEKLWHASRSDVAK